MVFETARAGFAAVAAAVLWGAVLLPAAAAGTDAEQSAAETAPAREPDAAETASSPAAETGAAQKAKGARPEAAPAASPEAPSASERAPEKAAVELSDLTAAEIRAVIERLASEPALAGALGADAQARALLGGLLAQQPRLLWRAEQVPAPEIPARFHQFPAALYLRTGSLLSARAAAFEEALAAFRAARQAAPRLTVILDLRASAPDPDPAAAAAVAGLFVPEGGPLFRWHDGGPGAEPEEFRSPGGALAEAGPLLLVVDGRVAGAAEAVALALAGKPDVVVIGSPTAGRLARLGRVVAREGIVIEHPRGRFEVLGGGPAPEAPLEPAIPTDSPRLGAAELFGRADKEGIGALVAETPLPRLNEAALVAGVNPELAAWEDAAGGENAGAAARKAEDPALKAALDVAEALRIREADPLRAGHPDGGGEANY